jgi:uncharacterized protein
VFADFLVSLRRRGLPVGANEWLAFHDALGRNLVRNLDDLYGVGRALLVHSEGGFDPYDLAFAETFHGAEIQEVSDAVKAWLDSPVDLAGMSPEAFERLTGMSLEELKRKFQETLAQQKERHDGGNRWVGTGGTSPWGSAGKNPQGIRVGQGGGRSAVQVAEERRYRNYRTDMTIDVRQFKTALRALRSLGREGEEVLDLDETIDETGRMGGEIELVFNPDRKNTVRLVLLMDAGGSMAPYARLVDRLFTAASEASHWKSFDHYFFHNCPYGRLYTDMERLEATPTEQVLRDHPKDAKIVFVGDACMAPWELNAVGGAIGLWDHNAASGIDWIQRFRRRFPNAIWLNPEPEKFWRHPTVEAIGNVLPMFPMSLDGLRAGIKKLKRGPTVR